MSPVARGHLPEHLQGNVGENFPTGVAIGYAYDFLKPTGISFHYEHELIIGPGFVWGFPAPGYMPNVGYMDIHGNFLTIDFTEKASFVDYLYDSFTISDPYDQLPEITGVTLYNNGGSAALTQDDIYVAPDGNSVTVELVGTSFNAGSMISLAFSFV
jgi:hypothetical protein